MIRATPPAILLKAAHAMNTVVSDHEVPDNGSSFMELLLHAYHNRRMALTTIAAMLSLAMLIASIVPPSYKATASVTVLPAPEYTVRQEAGSAVLNNTALAMDQIMEAESEILDSDDLHEAALQKAGPGSVYEELDPNFAPGLLHRALRPVVHTLLLPWVPVPADHRAAVWASALRRFRSHLTILPSKDGNVISATFSHSDPQVAARVINALIEAYAEHRSRIYDDPQLAAVRAQAEAGSRSVAAAEHALAAFKSTHDISDAATQRTLLLHRRSDAQQSAADAGAAARESKARLDSLAAQLRAEPVTVGLFQEHDPDTRVQTLLASLQDLRGRLAAARGRYLDTSRLVKDLNTQIAGRERELSQLVRDPSASVIRTGRNPDIDQLRLDAAHAASDLAAATARHDAAVAETARISTALANLDSSEVELARLERRVTLETSALSTESQVLASREMIEAEDARRFAKVRVIQAARIPQQPTLLPFLIIGAGLLLGLAAAAARLVAGFVTRPTFWTAEGLAAAANIDVLAVFPREAMVG
jgi:uncharacterized protein involved in exopolysaccharide biosynthesis